MAVKYTTVQKFWKFMGLNESVMDFQPGNTPSRETVASSPVTEGDYYLDQLGVNEDTLKLYAGSTQLTITTDYTFDSDTSKVSITAAGETALSGEDLTAEYEYNQLGKDLNYNETTRLLEQAEARLESETNAVFADQSASSPSYLQITSESDTGKGCIDNTYQVDNWPVVKLQTTVDGDYTTGSATLSLVDASGFPSSGTIYIGGNKVTYTAKSTNDLTVPTSTPSISDGATVRGEIVEVSTSPSGSDPTFAVLSPDSDYSIDYDTGRIQLMDEYYFQTDTSFEKPSDGVQDRLRFYYQHAWHEPGQDAEIPNEIEEIVYNMAGVQLLNRTILKANSGQRDNFGPGNMQQLKDTVESGLMRYRILKNSNV
jgi:hypothetical protein